MVTAAQNKIENNYKILNAFLENNPQYKELADIFNKFLYKKNKCLCEIAVGDCKSKCFKRYLTSTVREFNVFLSSFKSKPKYIIKNRFDTIVEFNLAMISNVHTNIEKYEDGRIFSYNIAFTYNQKDCSIDYNIRFVDSSNE